MGLHGLDDDLKNLIDSFDLDDLRLAVFTEMTDPNLVYDADVHGYLLDSFETALYDRAYEDFS